MQREGLADSEAGERGNIIDDAVREGGGGANEEDGVAIDESRDAGDVNAVGGGGAGDQVNFDAKVGACFEERCMCSFRKDPAR